MEKAIKKAHAGFTLVELIVVIAIVAILSTVGFVSYTGYITDSRNSVRESNLAEAGNVVTQFIATNGGAPRCTTDGTTPVANPAKCKFKEWKTGDASGIMPTDWGKMNVRSVPTDPKKSNGADVFYVFGTDGTDFEIAATKEEKSGYSAIVKGSKDTLGFIKGAVSTVVFDSPSPLPEKATCSADSVTAGAQTKTTDTVVNGKACLPYIF